MQCFHLTTSGQIWGHMISICLIVCLLNHVTLIQGYEEDTQGDSRNLHSLLHKMILGQQAIQRRNLATDWTDQDADLYADDDYFFSEPYKGLIYTKRKEPAVSEEYDSVQYSSTSLQDPKSGSKQAVVDLVVLADHGVYQEYLERYNFNKKKAVKSIKRYYTLLVHMIDSRYREIDSTEFSLRIKQSAVLVVEDPAAFQWDKASLRTWINPEGDAETVMDPHKALGYLHTWLQAHANLSGFDHIMAFTKYSLVKPGKTRPSSGMAYISTMCQTAVGFSVSVITEKGGFANVETATHELAHSLGATHDGGPGNEACSATDGHIMAPAQALKEHYGPNYFTFSACSIKSFKKMLSSSQSSCLYDSEPVKTISKLPGDFYSPDKQCKHVFGPLSGECRVPGIQKEELICQNLWCKDPNDKYGCITRSGLHAVYGTLCDQNKICYNGNCVDEDTIDRFDETLSSEDFHNEHIDVKDVLEGERYDSKDKSSDMVKSGLDKEDRLSKSKEIDLENSKLSEDNEKVDESNLSRGSQEGFHLKSNTETKQKESSIEHSAKARIPHPGDRRYLSHGRKIKTGAGSRKHHRKTTTSVEEDAETPQPTSIIPTSPAAPKSAPCAEDKSPGYCRNLLYTNGVEICNMDTLADYCCYTCSFYG